MESLFEFLKNAGPFTVIALLALIIYMMFKNTGVIDRLRGTQISDRQNVSDKADSDTVDLRVLNQKLDIIASNHLHGIPEMQNALSRIEARQQEQGERIAGVEAKVNILLK